MGLWKSYFNTIVLFPCFMVPEIEVIYALQGVAQETFVVASTIVGTYGYMAPEQFRGEARPASDLYSFGATLLFLLSGICFIPNEICTTVVDLFFGMYSWRISPGEIAREFSLQRS